MALRPLSENSAYISDVLWHSERRHMMLFIEGLVKPLRGWVKSLDPSTLQEVIKKERNLEIHLV